MGKGGGENPTFLQKVSVQLHDEAATSYRNFAFWICVLISAGFHDLHSLLEYSIAVTEYGEAHILSVIEFADLSGTLFHDQTISFSQRTSVFSYFSSPINSLCAAAEKMSWWQTQYFTAAWYREDSSIILGNCVTGRIMPSQVQGTEVETVRGINSLGKCEKWESLQRREESGQTLVPGDRKGLS